MFQDWEKKTKGNRTISVHLLWDINRTNIDWQAMRKLVVQRVIERGTEEDFYAIFDLYGGIEGVREIVKEIPAVLSPKDETFALRVFHLKKEDLQCYTRKRLREEHLNS
jgi:hypothetical protein